MLRSAIAALLVLVSATSAQPLSAVPLAGVRGALHHGSACWKDAQGRGAGRPVHECKPGLEQSGLLCYSPCKPGFSGVGPVCWEECKAGESDALAFCRRGDGHIRAKRSYGRGVGKPLVCSCHEQQDAVFFDLCYPQCAAGQAGVGPVCWSDCPAVVPVDGGAICCDSKGTCKGEVADMAVKLPLAVARAVRDRKDPVKEIADVKAAIEDALGFVLPLCHQEL